MKATKLRIVDATPLTPKEALGQIVPELIAAEAVVKRLKQMMADHGRALAKERQLAFIRDEHLRQEFGL